MIEEEEEAEPFVDTKAQEDERLGPTPGLRKRKLYAVVLKDAEEEAYNESRNNSKVKTEYEFKRPKTLDAVPDDLGHRVKGSSGFEGEGDAENDMEGKLEFKLEATITSLNPTSTPHLDTADTMIGPFGPQFTTPAARKKLERREKKEQKKAEKEQKKVEKERKKEEKAMAKQMEKKAAAIKKDEENISKAYGPDVGSAYGRLIGNLYGTTENRTNNKTQGKARGVMTQAKISEEISSNTHDKIDDPSCAITGDKIDDLASASTYDKIGNNSLGKTDGKTEDNPGHKSVRQSVRKSVRKAVSKIFGSFDDMADDTTDRKIDGKTNGQNEIKTDGKIADKVDGKPDDKLDGKTTTLLDNDEIEALLDNYMVESDDETDKQTKAKKLVETWLKDPTAENVGPSTSDGITEPRQDLLDVFRLEHTGREAMRRKTSDGNGLGTLKGNGLVELDELNGNTSKAANTGPSTNSDKTIRPRKSSESDRFGLRENVAQQHRLMSANFDDTPFREARRLAFGLDSRLGEDSVLKWTGLGA
ncbi:MAG: hypothetical protein MMC33_002774 [Icmadophila ericetorum]|nr:hypothetical protein [Icmadophila ericetorum]